MKRILMSLLGVMALQVMGAMPLSANIEIGKAAPAFSLKDTQGASRALADFKGKYVVLEWTNPECPFVIKHYGSQNMQNLQKTSAEKGVAWLSINSSAEGKQGHYSAEQFNAWISEAGAQPTALLLDQKGDVGKLYGAQTTPHMFIINPDGVLIYQGAIDSIESTDQTDIPQSVNYVEKALNEAQAGQPVSVSSTKAYGCSVKYP